MQPWKRIYDMKNNCAITWWSEIHSISHLLHTLISLNFPEFPATWNESIKKICLWQQVPLLVFYTVLSFFSSEESSTTLLSHYHSLPVPSRIYDLRPQKQEQSHRNSSGPLVLNQLSPVFISDVQNRPLELVGVGEWPNCSCSKILDIRRCFFFFFFLRHYFSLNLLRQCRTS